MPDDVEQQVCTEAESFVSSRPRQFEGEYDDLKHGLKEGAEGSNEKPDRSLLRTLISTQDSAMRGNAETLKEWTGKSRTTTIFDSTIDEFTDECLFQKVRDKPNIAVIATTTDGDVFGGYYNVAVTEQDEHFWDPNLFIFSFKSHGRCMTPQKFVVKKEWKKIANVKIFKDFSDGWFVMFFGGGGGGFSLGNEQSDTWCDSLSNGFEAIEDTTLTGKNLYDFICCRLVAIQLE